MYAYVLTPAYVGRDRRVRPRVRCIERRRVDADALAPSLEGALRQLSMRVMELDCEATAAGFIVRLNATAALAQSRRQPKVAAPLRVLNELLASPVDGPKSETAETYLRQAICALS